MCWAFSHSNRSNLYKFIAIVITLYSLGGCASQVATHDKSPAVSPEEIEQALATSEKLFSERADTEKLREAVKTLGSVRNPDDRNFEVEWKFSKYSYFLGKLESDQAKAEDSFEKGRDAGRIAARVQKDRPEGHFWYAANLGELSKMSPVTVGIRSVDEIRAAMETVISIDPGFQGASAYDALGQLEIATRNFKGGKTEKAVEYYEKGLALSPDNANIRLHLAEAYLSLRRDADARRQLDALLAMKPHPDYAVEHAAAVAKAKDLLAKNF